MKVTVAVTGPSVPAWHGWVVDALRALAGVDVRVVAAPGATPWSPPKGIAAKLGGAAMAPHRLVLDADAYPADVVVDLSDGGAPAAGTAGTFAFRLGASRDAALPFAAEIAGGARTFEAQLVRTLDGRSELLRRGVFGVTMWYPSTVRTALAQTATWPAVCVAALRGGVPLPADPVGDAPDVRALGPFDRLRFGVSLTRRFAAAVTDMLFEVVEWNVGFVEGGARRLIAGEPLAVRWLRRPAKLTFVADPFVAERDGVRALFVEEFDYGRNRGVIEAHVLDDEERVVSRARVLDLPTHLSYPYPLEIDDELYLIPENCAANEVVLYRCVAFPHRWERETALFPGLDGVDTTLFPHEGRWWAFTTRASRGSTLALYAFHAASPRGPWSPHVLNPIVVDVASARPGGQPFRVDGVLYRPAQDCSSRYGGALAIARVDELTPTTYRETVVRRIDGREFVRWNGGVHTLSFTRDRLVIDGQHVYRDPRKLSWALRRIVARLGRLGRRKRAAARAVA